MLVLEAMLISLYSVTQSRQRLTACGFLAIQRTLAVV